MGISRNTVKKYLEDPDLAFAPAKKGERKSQLDPFIDNIDAWLKEDSEYSGTWIYDRLCNMGFSGSYEIVKRKVHELKEKMNHVAFMRFETEPGYQAQVDFGEFVVEHADLSSEKRYLFSMILGYSRKIYAELVKACDLPTFLDCHLRAFEYFGGIPEEILYDRMKNVFIGRFCGKNRFNDTLVGFSIHYGFEPQVAPAYAAWVKGKIERPYSFIREGFWRGYGYSHLETANRDLALWIKQKDQRVHGTTHEVVEKRFEREKVHLGGFPKNPFDTSYRIYRKAHKDCTVRFEANSFVLPHELAGKPVVLRVKNNEMRIFSDNQLVVTYAIPPGKGNLVQDPRFYEALRKDRQMNSRKYHNGRRMKGRAKRTISPSKPLYDMDVEIRPALIYDHLIEEVRI